MKKGSLLLLPLLFSLLSCTQDLNLLEEKITEKVNNILQLPLHEMVYRDIIYLDETKTFFLIKTVDKRLLFSVQIRIQAGYDLTEGFKVSVISPREAVVSLPEPKILLADADESTIKQFFSKETGGAISLLSYYEEIDRKKPALIEDALSRGILIKAASNGEAMIRGILESLGFSSIRFEKLGA